MCVCNSQLQGSGAKLHVVGDVASVAKTLVDSEPLAKAKLDQPSTVRIALRDAHGNATARGEHDLKVLLYTPHAAVGTPLPLVVEKDAVVATVTPSGECARREIISLSSL